MDQSKPKVETITREIGIDAGHRVPLHASKCRALHGHRYVIQATCAGEVQQGGPQDGMILDFSFLKEEMMAEIDASCDHALIMQYNDPILRTLMPLSDLESARVAFEGDDASPFVFHSLDERSTGILYKIYLIPYAPTAENLARHWFEKLAPRVEHRSAGKAHLRMVRVWETPNCYADHGLS